jgi:hypothetical protein
MPEFASEAVTVVVRGHFNPAIFSPGWLFAQGLIGREQTEFAEIQAIVPQAAIFSAGWVNFQATPDMLSLATEDPVEYPRLRDLAVSILRLLKETPVNALGINRAVHMKVDSIEDWHRLGDTVAPKAIWEKMLSLPGTASLSIRGVRQDDYAGFVQVRFEPSNAVPCAIFIEQNDHFVLKEVAGQPETREELFDPRYSEFLVVEPSPSLVSIAVEILTRRWDSSISRGNEIARQLWDLKGRH